MPAHPTGLYMEASIALLSFWLAYLRVAPVGMVTRHKRVSRYLILRTIAAAAYEVQWPER